VVALLSPRLGGRVRALPLPGDGAAREGLVQRGRVALAVVPLYGGEARLQGRRRHRLVSGLAVPTPDGLERAGLYNG
jgi:hypothetical protein